MRILLLVLVLSFNTFGQDMPRTPRNIQGGYTASDFWTQWESTTPRMALFVKVTPQTHWTGVSALGFTSNTRDMTLPGHSITFKSSPGLSPSKIEMGLGDPVNLEMMGIYESGSFEYKDVMAGKWDFAEVEVFSASWNNVNLGELLWFKGNLADFKDYQTYFNAEGRGLISRLSTETDKVTQRLCRANFRDDECGHTGTTVTLDGVAYDVVQNSVAGSQAIGFETIVFDTSTFAGNKPADNPALDDFYAPAFANGTITALDGENAGATREIVVGQGFGNPTMYIHLKRLFPYAITPGTLFTITMGCNKTTEDCTKFVNIENFRGEPFVPGIETVNRIE